MIKRIYSDFINYKRRSGLSFLFDLGFYAIVLYRVGSYTFVRRRKINPFWYAYCLCSFFLRLFVKIELSPRAVIGDNFFLPHPSTFVMNGDVRIGNNCTIGPGVVLGHLKGVGTGVPSIGNDVYIGPKASILGPVKIGDNCVIGAHALVIQDMPPNSVAHGPKALIKSFLVRESL